MYNTSFRKIANVAALGAYERATRSVAQPRWPEMKDPTSSKKETFIDKLTSKEKSKETSKEKSHLGRNLAIGGVGLGAAGLGAYLWHKSKKKQALQKKAMELINYYY